MPRFIDIELERMKEEFMQRWNGEDGDHAIGLVCDIAEERAKSYTWAQCFQIIQHTSVPPEDIDFDMAVQKAPKDGEKFFRQIVTFILSIELQGFPQVHKKIGFE